MKIKVSITTLITVINLLSHAVIHNEEVYINKQLNKKDAAWLFPPGEYGDRDIIVALKISRPILECTPRRRTK